MTTKTQTRKIPAPLYAAAGAGDLAYERLRKLVTELRPAVTEAVSEPRLRADLGKLRKAARRNAAAFRTGAQAAQERATAVYTDLVKRGERVVRVGRRSAATSIEKAAAEVREGGNTQPAAPDKTVRKAVRPAATRPTSSTK
jgi:heparin binding hemagglutinin HbhA